MLKNFLNNFFQKKKNNLSEEVQVCRKTIFGFWIYIMSDCIIFSTIFAVYFVMIHNISNGPSGKDFFNLKFVFLETFFLLLSSLCFSIAISFLKKCNSFMVMVFLFFVFILGFFFITMEVIEFLNLFKNNYLPSRSGFLSSFYTLLWLHGFHVICGLFWIILMIFQIHILGIDKTVRTRILCLSIFWHFLDIIWIFLFTFVYLCGAIQ